MAFDFPSSPSDGQVFTPAGGPSYTYNAAGTKWLVSATSFTGQPLDALLTSISALTFGADNFIYGTGTDTAAAGTVTSFMRTLLDDATVTTALSTLTIISGQYTPTITNAVNVAASTAHATNYLRIGDIFIVFGYCSIDTTTAADTLSQISITLPSSSALAVTGDLTGVAATHTAGSPVRILADVAANQAQFNWASNDASNATFSFIFGYRQL